ncbi:patatin-like phospholipase family protein [Magnetospirillum fulvum]|uniref:Alpha-beta hydrolase family esterase n=1 Tax=Magnetospirillum fulvum MGU-K5 TaxID=1316936 RepID=S9TIC2_MAGFU|nr:patatin-like phospholipase family protein [Magnetospirillum fulvum]EPY01996.1 alpha-beta hydrolase family esterase [Magnetospirillum fulvum MGU-K5]
MEKPHRIALALQGGGTHGAFAWGVLDGLLDQVVAGNVEIVGISGASSGALTATAFAYGCHQGAGQPGPATARTRRIAEAGRDKIRELWETIARVAFWSGNPFVAAVTLGSGWNIDDSTAARWADVAGSTSPVAETGLGGSLSAVLREVMPEIPAIFALPQPGTPSLVIAATDIGEGRRKLFVDGAVSPDALRASNCKPAPFSAVEIDGHLYWDGGYLGNPPLTCLAERLRETEANDLVLVTINPLRRDGPPPRSARHVADRLNELTFNAALIHEINTIETVNRLVDAKMIADPPPGQHPFRHINLHRIEADAEIAALGVYSKEAPAWDFLVHLRDMGRRAFEQAWPTIAPALGKASTWDTTSVCDHILARKAILPP